MINVKMSIRGMKIKVGTVGSNFSVLKAGNEYPFVLCFVFLDFVLFLFFIFHFFEESSKMLKKINVEMMLRRMKL